MENQIENINKNIQVIGIIPSRMESTRLPNKPILDIKGKCLVQRVWEAASQSNILQRVVIATDSDEIVDRCFDFGAEFVMTDSDLPSGTDRIMQAYNKLNETADYVINIQGDEPLLTGEIIDNLLKKFIDSKADVGTMVSKIKNTDEIFDENVVKVLLKSDMTAVDFSREPTPYFKDIHKDKWLKLSTFWKHIGIYAYKINSLKQFVNLPVSLREKKERLEQIRLLEKGYKYYCVETKEELIGVDTPEDLETVRKLF